MTNTTYMYYTKSMKNYQDNYYPISRDSKNCIYLFDEKIKNIMYKKNSKF